MGRILVLLIACNGGALSSNLDAGGNDAALSCTSDDQCGAHAYCRGLLQRCRSDCQLTIGTAAVGVCHRSCVGRDAHCACVDDTDCPGLFTSCDVPSGTCKTIAPPICHSQCPAGCADSSDVQYGEICICSSC